MPNKDLTQVFVVDDTAIYRKILSDAVREIEGLELAGTAPRGDLALQKLKHTPCDIVLLDIFMPDMDGLQTLQLIRKDFPKLTVIMVSGATNRDAAITINALRSGAAEFIAKPQAKSFAEGMEVIRTNLERVIRSLGFRTRSASPIPPSRPSTPIPTPPRRALSSPPSSIELVVVGVSTGGPKTLNSIIPLLPANLAAPVLLVQHMPPMFTASLAEHLDRDSALSVREAVEGEPVKRGDVLIAPGGRHMVVSPRAGGHVIALNDNPPVNSCRPAVDVLFDSVAQHVNKAVLAVILTGMGEDGARGVANLKHKTCYCLSQSKDSCVVYGMPQAVESRGLADEVLHSDKIAERITQLVNRR